jgi:hypothetical protein
MSDILFHLIFGETHYLVPIDSVNELLEDHEELFDTMSYTVRSPVSLEDVDSFVQWLRTGRKDTLCEEDWGAFFPLATEFGIQELMAECQATLLGRPKVQNGSEALARVPASADEWPAFLRRLVGTLTEAMARLEMLEAAVLKLAKSLPPEAPNGSTIVSTDQPREASGSTPP